MFSLSIVLDWSFWMFGHVILLSCYYGTASLIFFFPYYISKTLCFVMYFRDLGNVSFDGDINYVDEKKLNLILVSCYGCWYKALSFVVVVDMPGICFVGFCH